MLCLKKPENQKWFPSFHWVNVPADKMEDYTGTEYEFRMEWLYGIAKEYFGEYLKGI